MKMEVVKELCKMRQEIVFKENILIKNESIILIDFYNVYCNFIKFNENKLFTEESFFCCLNLIVETFKKYHKVYIISKPVFESRGYEKIHNIIKNYSNIEYIIIEDKNKNSGQNRERDDFYLIYLYNLNKYSKKDVYIVSNDQFRNYTQLIRSVKPIEIIRITCNIVEYAKNFNINSMKECLFIHSHKELARVEFKF